MHGNATMFAVHMVTKLLHAELDAVEAVREAAELLRRGSLVAIPTETVYGLAACISNEDALATIFRVKGRPADNPLIVHVAHPHDVSSLAAVDELSAQLIASFWPGPLTLVLPKKEGVSDFVTAALTTVAIRMPALAITRAIIEAVGEPLAAPSANISGRPSATTAAHVLADFGGRIAAIVDAGPCAQGIESTVVRVLDGRVVMLRPGGISRSHIEAVIGAALLDADTHERASPGTRHRHYAPSARVILCDTVDSLKAEAVGKVIVLSTEQPPVDVPWRKLSAQTLYAELRRADDLHVNKILVHCTNAVLLDEALMNRLRKAAEPFRESGVDQ